MLRTAAGWRALRVALLVGGVLVIGLLCGERAYAANGVPGLTDADVTAGRIDSPGPRSLSGAGSASRAGADVAAVGERVVRVVPVVRVVGDTGEALSNGRGEVRAKEPSSPSASVSSLPSFSPSSPSSPSLPPPSLPKLPVSAGLPALPLPELPVPAELPALADPPTAPAPALPKPPTLPALPALPVPPDLPGVPDPPDLPDPPNLPGAVGRTSATDLVAAATADIVVRGGDHHAVGRAEHPGHTRRADHADPSAHVGHGPGGSVPAHRPDGTLGNRSSADGGTSRHGDAYVVTPSDCAPLRLLSGVAARSCTAGTQDGHRDIRVFPG